MQEVFQVAGAIIFSFGGSSVILLGLSTWLGKVWANRILEGEKAKYTKEIENYKNKLNKDINIVNSIIDKSVYVSKLQYDKEFSIYLEIWEKLASCVISTKNLYPTFENVPTDEEALTKFKEEKWKRFVDGYNEFSNTITKYSPFYDGKLYRGFVELRDLCSGQGRKFHVYEFEVKYSATFAMARDTRMSSEEFREVYTDFPKKIDDIQNSLQEEIRGYLKSLQAIEA